MIKKIKDILQFYNKHQNDRLFLFRSFSVLVALNFLLVIWLSGMNLFSLFNPFAFLTNSDFDKRSEVYFYLPLSFQLDVQEKKVEKFKTKILWEKTKKEKDLVEINATILMDVLLDGIYNPRAAKIAINKKEIRKLWVQDKTLIIDAQQSIWQKINSSDRLLFQTCIEKTFLENFPQIEKVTWSYFSLL